MPLAAAEGGRSRPIFSGYRPDWNIADNAPDGEAVLRGGQLTLLQEPLSPGEVGEGEIEPLLPDEAWRGVKPGDRLTFYEGLRPVGYAVVL